MSEEEPKVAKRGAPRAAGGRQGEARRERRIPFVLAVYGASRLFYLLAGALLARVVPVGQLLPDHARRAPGRLNIWAHWDGVWYSQIATEGYAAHAPASTAFFPLYPLLMRSFAEVFGGPLSLGAMSAWGVLISLAFLPFALYFVYRIAEEGWGEEVAAPTTHRPRLLPYGVLPELGLHGVFVSGALVPGRSGRGG